MIKIFCVKNYTVMHRVPTQEIVVAPYRYKTGLGCPTCRSVEGFLIRVPDMGDHGLGKRLQEHGCGSSSVVWDRHKTFNTPHCDCRKGFSIERLKEFMEYVFGCYKPQFENMEVLSWTGLAHIMPADHISDFRPDWMKKFDP